MIQRLYVTGESGHDSAGADLGYEVRHTLGVTSVASIRTAKMYRLEGIDESAAHSLASRLLVDVGERYSLNSSPFPDAPHQVDVAYRPGVMNPESASIEKAAQDLGVTGLVAADSCRAYAFYGSVTGEEVAIIVNRLLINPTVEEQMRVVPETLRIDGQRPPIATIPIRTMTDGELMALSADTLFLNLVEMHAIRDHFLEAGRDPTDGELEMLAQSWSEHCIHKTFNAPLVVDGQPKASLFSRLREASLRHPAGVVSSFVDNSGVIELYDGWSICAKVETHNSPSAIEPYGGAMTGSGGVFRDIAGTGQGARVIASTDIFCVAPPDLPAADLPPGCLAPRYLLRRIVDGVRDYGNRTGIPTCNGSVTFHRDFRAKPTVIAGAYGLIPSSLARKGVPRTGDAVIAAGGRTGRDGIHGATFASAAMTSRTGTVNGSAVQIGNAIEEKRLFDALLVCRDRGLIRAVTDCGAGGFSSAIGELGRPTGVHVDLARAPLKYGGLAPWEIWVSESQERMVIAADPDDVAAVIAVCRDYNVDAVVLGAFTDDRRVRVDVAGEVLCDLPVELVFDGVPIPPRVARRDPQRVPSAQTADPPASLTATQRTERALAVLRHGDVCSKEPIARLYDHNVQGSSALPPFVGVRQDGPADAAVLSPVLGEKYGVVIAHGMHPVGTRADPHGGALWSIAEAISNAAAVGGRLEDLALIDNFIWPAPDEHWLWSLDRTIDACVEAVDTLGIPFVSGKDSLSSTYRWPSGERLDIPPVFCVSAFGRMADVRRSVSADIKRSGTGLVLLGDRRDLGLGASVYADLYGSDSATALPQADLRDLSSTVGALHRCITDGLVLACHDISQGGLWVTLVEMAIGGERGVDVDLVQPAEGELFAETAGCFVIETADAEAVVSAAMAMGVGARVLGHTGATSAITVRAAGDVVVTTTVDRCREEWQRPMRELFHSGVEQEAS